MPNDWSGFERPLSSRRQLGPPSRRTRGWRRWLSPLCAGSLILMGSACAPETSKPSAPKPPASVPTPSPPSIPASGPDAASPEWDAASPGRDAAVADSGVDFDQCAAAIVSGNQIPTNLLFVIDRSGSMNCIPPDGDDAEAQLCERDPRRRGDGPSKWDVTHQALTAALTPLVGRPEVNVGLALFPQAQSRCGVNSEPAVAVSALDEAQLQAMDDVLSSVAPDGDTPIAGSAILSYAHLATALKQKRLKGNTFLVLLTDGNETCKTTELSKLLESDVPAAREGFGIRTFVIGAPGSEPARALLSRIAYHGGTASSPTCDHGSDPQTADCHLDMTRSLNFQADLGAVLDEIATARALSCEFEVPRNPGGSGVDHAQVNVRFVDDQDPDGVTIGKHEGTEGSCDDKAGGWTYSDGRHKILVCGESCELLQRSKQGELHIVLGCPSVIRPIPR